MTNTRLCTKTDDKVNQLVADLDLLTANLTHAVCQVDYWLNSVRFALWFASLSEEVDTEQARGLFDGLEIGDDYAEVSGVCTVSEDGSHWVLQQ